MTSTARHLAPHFVFGGACYTNVGQPYGCPTNRGVPCTAEAAG